MRVIHVSGDLLRSLGVIDLLLTHHSGTSLYRRMRRVVPSSKPV